MICSIFYHPINSNFSNKNNIEKVFSLLILMNNFYIYFSAVISIASQFNNQYFKFFLQLSTGRILCKILLKIDNRKDVDF